MLMVNSKAGRLEPPESFDIRHGTTGFGVCIAGFQSYDGLVFPHCVQIPIFCATVCWKYVI